MKIIIGWFIALCLVTVAVAWLVFVFSINRAVVIAPGTVVTIESGQSLSQIAATLEERQLIRSAWFLKVHAKLSGKQAAFQAGEYLLEGEYDTKELVTTLTSGAALSNEVAVLIREGLSVKNIAGYLTEQGVVGGQDFQELALTRVGNLPAVFARYDWLQQLPATATLEGYLFPDTYRLFQDATAEDLVLKMLDNFEAQVINGLQHELQATTRDLHQVMIMASLVEKEVRSVEDMHVVSGIFWQRLAIRQPLQSCATLAYILGVNKAQYTLEDTKVQSPYNTYQHYGLPPGPIANPGLQAIKAALQPTETNYNYFLSRPDTGETVFAASYEEHLRHKAKYLP